MCVPLSLMVHYLPWNKAIVMPNPLMEEERRCVCNHSPFRMVTDFHLDVCKNKFTCHLSDKTHAFR